MKLKVAKFKLKALKINIIHYILKVDLNITRCCAQALKISVLLIPHTTVEITFLLWSVWRLRGCVLSVRVRVVRKRLSLFKFLPRMDFYVDRKREVVHWTTSFFLYKFKFGKCFFWCESIYGEIGNQTMQLEIFRCLKKVSI